MVDTAPVHWLKVKVIGTISDAQAFGARVSVFQAGTSTLLVYSQVQSQSGYEGFNSLIQHFGESLGPPPTPTNTPIIAEVGSSWKDYR